MREVVNYLKDLNYSKSNYEGVRVHYGSDLRAISVKPQYSINLTPGQITIFTKKMTFFGAKWQILETGSEF